MADENGVAGDFPGRAHRRPGRSADNVVRLARLQRSAGEAVVSFKCREGRTVLDGARQSGCCKVRFPRQFGDSTPEAVLINTAGGLTDGDHVSTVAHWRPDTCAAITTQAAERIYRSRGGDARVTNRLNVARGATALWLPQETIMFDGGRLTRRLEADIAEGGQLLACESVVFGRTAMGESVDSGALGEAWRVHLGGRLVFADGFRLAGNVSEALARPAVARGAVAIASIVYAGANAAAIANTLQPEMARRESVAGCSTNGSVLVARILAHSGAALRRDLVVILQFVLQELDGHRSVNANKTPVMLPRSWFC